MKAVSPVSSVRSARAVVRPVRDAERTQATILAAATHEFARHGLGGARVDRIASRAGSNKRMLYYYFGSKEKLFLAVLEKTYADIRTAEQALNLLDASPTDGVRRLIEFTWEYFIAHPEFLTLLNSENLHQARHLKRSKHIREMNSPLIETLGTLLVRGQRDGSFRSGVDPLQLYISIASLSYFFLSNRHTLAQVFGPAPFSATRRRSRLEHMTALVLGYLAQAESPAAARR
ncbi:MAG: TetR/AcrR family transcriptional regulator [Burkholderiales bacterium]